MSTAPARISGLVRHGHPLKVGGPANLVVFNPDAEWSPSSFHSKSNNSPFVGFELKGRVLHTVWEGKLTHTTTGVPA
jgi:dihydroorotase